MEMKITKKHSHTHTHKLTLMAIFISAAILSTASFAWFTMNDVVAVTGIGIEAVASASLFISTSQSSGYSTSVNFTGGVAALKPSSTTNLSNWYAPAANTGIDFVSGGFSKDTVFGIASGEDGYYRKETVYIKAQPPRSGKNTSQNNSGEILTEDVFASVIVSDIIITRGAKQSDVTGSLRVGVICGETALIFDINSLYSPRGTNAVSSLDENGGAILSLVMSSAAGRAEGEGEFPAVIARGVGETPVQIDIYVWYEGQDPACTMPNTAVTEDVLVSLSFKGTAE